MNASQISRTLWLTQAILLSSFTISYALDVSESEVGDMPLLTTRIESIEVTGNERTRKDVILNLCKLDVGEELTEAMLASAKGRIDSSSLFEEITIKKKPGTQRNRVRLEIVVKEKISWFVIPSYHYSKGGQSGGAALVDVNFLGRAKKGLAYVDYGSRAYHAILGYRDPSFLNTNFTLALDGLFRKEDMGEFQKRKEIGRIRLKDTGLTAVPGYRWQDRFAAGIGFYYHHVNHKISFANSPFIRTPNLRNGNDLAVVLRFDIDDIRNHLGLQYGSEVHAETAVSDERFNSDYDYFKQIVRGKYGLLFYKDQLNLLSSASIQYGRTLPYYQELMIGGDNLRGYLDREFRGDTRYSMAEEFLFPIYPSKKFIVRGLAFWDSAAIYFKDNKFKRSDWHNGVGGGLRFYLKWIAIPLVGVDAGYGIEDHEYAIHLNIGATI